MRNGFESSTLLSDNPQKLAQLSKSQGIQKMEPRKQKRNANPCPTSPFAIPPSSSIFRDVSNCKTPKYLSRNPSFQASPPFFTASKITPLSSYSRSGMKGSGLRSKVARRLKVFELEQTKSARKIQALKEKSLKSLTRSLTVWLNFLFENPSTCGCDPAKFTGEIGGADLGIVGRTKELFVNNGKRESEPGWTVGFDGPWRGPKRQRGSLWRGEEGATNEFSNSTFFELKKSLQDICSFEDLKERMRIYISLRSCKEIFEAMTQVTKNIDEGRLKMRASCPIVSDVGMKEKALRTLMCYNPIWLRIGLYLILGGDSLLPNVDVSSEQETAFLRTILDKQFLSHHGLAKEHAYNKLVEGLYRPGYYEKLGNIILKRFLLLVIIIDRAKFQTSLPLIYGIDGLDGGSPLLFSSKSTVKSSRQLVNEFLSSDVMHGEGNLLAHLMIVGYKVTYQQNPLIEYDFKITDLFEDLQDGVRLCRVIELLKHDPSILLKVVVPSDTQKKSLANCDVAWQYLKEAHVPLLDEDGTEIIAVDVVNRDKELTLSLLWNIFIHLQLPLLINKTLLSEEISNIRGDAMDDTSTQTLLNLLLSWIQAICETYEVKVDSHSSLLDGKAMWCLLDYYFRKEHYCSCSSKDLYGAKKEVYIMSAIEYTDAVHNFLLSQKLASLLGNFPEVLQVSDILEDKGACSDKSVIVLLVFLSVQLLVKRNMDKLNYHKLLCFSCQSSDTRRCSTESNNEKDPSRDFSTIMTWWQDMAQHNGKGNLKPSALSLTGKKGSSIQRGISQEFLKYYEESVQRIYIKNAAIIIQSHYRQSAERRNYASMKNAALLLQRFAFAWLAVKKKLPVKELGTNQGSISSRGMHLGTFVRDVTFLTDRHYFVNLKKSSKVIQQAIRDWILRKHYRTSILNQIHNSNMIEAAIVIQSSTRGWLVRSAYAPKITLTERDSVIFKEDTKDGLQTAAAIKIQKWWKGYVVSKSIQRWHCAATIIQRHYRGWLIRWRITSKKLAIRTIQRCFRCSRSRRDYKIHREKNSAAMFIQSHLRGWMARQQDYREKCLFIKLQSFCRMWLQRKEFLLHKDAAIRIQSVFRCMSCHKAFISQRLAVVAIQACIRGENARRRLQGGSCHHKSLKHDPKELEMKLLMQSVLKLQKWWRQHVLHVEAQKNAALIIQSHLRGWLVRRMAKREMQQAIVIQSYWKGYVVRKHAKSQLLDLRVRMEKSAANVDDSRRLINRLIAALSELLNMKSISNILHTCATLDMATELSQKCCEELVAAGAIGTLLKLIRSVSRSIPDQQVLKHALSTLRNLSRYPHLTEIMAHSPQCLESVLMEFLRNKEEAYFIASEILKKMFLNQHVANTIRRSPSLLRRMNNLAEELARKVGYDKRTARNLVTRENTERRLREVVELLKLVSRA